MPAKARAVVQGGTSKYYYIVFCELYGEANAMIFDLKNPSPDMEGSSVLEADRLDQVRDWVKASRSFMNGWIIWLQLRVINIGYGGNLVMLSKALEGRALVKDS